MSTVIKPSVRDALSRLESAVDWYLGRSAFTQTNHLKGMGHSDAVRKELYAAHDEARLVLSSCPKCGSEEWDNVTAERGRERDVPFNRCNQCDNEWGAS